MPPPAACLNCHDSKKRCLPGVSAGFGDARCLRCLRLGRRCVWPSPLTIPDGGNVDGSGNASVQRRRAPKIVFPSLVTLPGLGKSNDPVRTFGATKNTGIPFSPTGSVPSVVARGPPVTSMPPADVVLAAVAGFLDTEHLSLHYVNRAVFEAAFTASSGSPSPEIRAVAIQLYGGPPRALLYAIASAGMRRAMVPGLEDMVRWRFARECAVMAKDLLLAGYYAHLSGGSGAGPARTPVSEIEALQTLGALNYGTYFSGYSTAVRLPLQERINELCLSLCFDSSGAPRFGRLPPRDCAEWLKREIIQRNAIVVSWAGADWSYYIFTPIPTDWFSKPFSLPAADFFFDDPNPIAAFNALYGGLAPHRSVVLDFSPLLQPDPDFAQISVAVTLAISSVFNGQASVKALMALNGAVRVHRCFMQNLAVQSGIDVTRIAASDPADDDPMEARYRRLSAVFDHVISTTYAAMPPGIGAALMEGDPRPLIRSRMFPDARQAHVVLGYILALRSTVIEHWVSPAPRIDPSFFTSPALARILAEGVTIIATATAQLDIDPPGPTYSHLVAFYAVLKAGMLAISVTSLLRELGGVDAIHVTAIQAAEEDALGALRYLEACCEVGSPPILMLSLRSYQRALELNDIRQPASNLSSSFTPTPAYSPPRIYSAGQHEPFLPRTRTDGSSYGGSPLSSYGSVAGGKQSEVIGKGVFDVDSVIGAVATAGYGLDGS
ncbi:hypothetical protein DFJ74DRAFT_672524 [Hyaloraphidium curvatum]|nr:hypothetical protein DFJ74DRAFT_672524 [Hyaloraphidium curvatum]